VRDGVTLAGVAAAGLAAGAEARAAKAGQPIEQIRKTRSYNPNMEYRRLGSTGLWVSAVCLGGHWKRVDKVIGMKAGAYAPPPKGPAADALRKNRHDVLTRCMEVGINYVDACTKGEVSVYGPALKGRRDKMYFGFAMWPECPRKKEYGKADQLLKTLDEGLELAEVDHVDISLAVKEHRELDLKRRPSSNRPAETCGPTAPRTTSGSATGNTSKPDGEAANATAPRPPRGVRLAT